MPLHHGRLECFIKVMQGQQTFDEILLNNQIQKIEGFQERKPLSRSISRIARRQPLVAAVFH